MNNLLQRHNQGINWIELTHLIDQAGLGKREPADVEQTFKGSFAVSNCVQNQKIVGAGRAISDGINTSVIYDVVVMPERQGQGIGRLVMSDLLAQLPKRSVMLLSVPEKIGFYKKLGFQMLKTAMMKHENPEFWIANNYLDCQQLYGVEY